jgi:outer membrane lipoprotein-sorting protein
MKKMYAFVFIGLLGVWSVPVRAEVPQELKTPSNNQILAKVESLLNSVKTMQSKFVQFNSVDDANLIDGTFYLSRPNKMRLIYNPPVELEFVADGKSLIYHDKTFDQITHLSLDETPASILLKEKFSFDDPSVLVTDIREILDDYEITAVQKDNPALGSITLVVTKQPVSLRQWDILDAQGIKTSIALYDNQYNVPVDSSLFVFKDPRMKKNTGDLTKRRGR